MIKKNFSKQCNVMILILIIFITTQQNSPQNKHFIFTNKILLQKKKINHIDLSFFFSFFFFFFFFLNLSLCLINV